jgi:2-iminoacetate synthase ThiH
MRVSEAAVASFTLDADAVQARLAAAAAAGSDVRDGALARARAGAPLAVDDLAVLWTSPVDAAVLHAAACAARALRPRRLETFAPLYLTNTCDAECRMCGMRRDNEALHRETVDLAAVDAQLEILRRRGMHGVALLTGEYRAGGRGWAVAHVNAALRRAAAHGFRHVLINIGALDAAEYQALFTGLPRHGDGRLLPKLTMCTFQETYARPLYRRFMGVNPDNPRADFDRRLANFDRAREAGMRVANPGILVGLNPDLGFELIALALHAQHLLAAGMEVYLSVPRLRQIAGRANQRGADDESFVRLVSILSLGLPAAKIVLTTREPAEIQRRLVPLVAVLSAGSAAVAPYTARGARFPLESSQFEVIDQRPFEAILSEYVRPGITIENFEPPPGPA